MNPALTLCLMICPICFAVAGGLFWADRSAAATFLGLIGLAPLAVALWQMIRFTMNDPDRLQRDQHLENMLQIKSMLAIKNDEGIKEVTIAGEIIENPQLEGFQR